MSVVTTSMRSDSDQTADDFGPAAVQPAPWLAAWTLCRREWVRFVRQGNRVFAALGQPIIFWILLSGLLGTSFQMDSGAGAGGANSNSLVAPAVATATQPTVVRTVFLPRHAGDDHFVHGDFRHHLGD